MALDVVLQPLRERLASELIRVARDMPPDARTALESIGTSLENMLPDDPENSILKRLSPGSDEAGTGEAPEAGDDAGEEAPPADN